MAVLCLIALPACMHTAASGPGDPGDGASLPALRPSLLALSVGDLDASIAWYAGVLGFVEGERYDFPADRMRMAFMKHGDFELELIELADAPPFSAPDPGNPATRRGLVKIAFYTGGIEPLHHSARASGAEVQTALRNSNRTGGRFFILLDPDGNWVQVFGPAE
jgi:catechol 2,3-dioxygenase-like lactoylglutathione lyase family enzyme